MFFVMVLHYIVEVTHASALSRSRAVCCLRALFFDRKSSNSKNKQLKTR